MFDVFYQGPKPDLFVFERPAENLDDALRQSKTEYCWFIYGNNDYSQFDFDYVPPPWQKDFVHTWPNQHQIDGEVYLAHKTNNGQPHYHAQVINRKAVAEYWDIKHNVTGIDPTWCPDPLDPPFIYVFGNQWNNALDEASATYTIPGATQKKYMLDMPLTVLPSRTNYNVLVDAEFDFSWRPNPNDPPYTYVFGNQWYPAERMPTIEYHVPGATDKKFINYIQAQLPAMRTPNWTTLVECDWDYSWCPDAHDPPYMYVFGNQWYPAERMPTVTYLVEGATETKYMEYPRATLLPTTKNWQVLEDAEIDFDYSWCPDPHDPPFTYVFGNQYWSGERSATIEYHVPGATERKYVGEIHAELATLDIFFIDRGNEKSQVRFDILSARHKVTRVRYANSLFETVQRCVNRAQTNRFWVISSDYNYKDFDFAWHPEPWQQSMTHVFPSQHNKWSDTFLINRWEFERHARWATSLEQFPNLNFVTNQQVDKTDATADIYYVDHGNPESEDNYNYFKVAIGEAIRTRFVGEYLDVLKRIVNTAETEYVWVVSSLCRYNYFDFTWEPEPWQREMIHCFASGSQKRGDTFYIHVESFKQQMVELELLDWFNVINYVENISVDRYLAPVHVYTGDDLITEIKNYDFKTPYVTFTNQPDLTLAAVNCLWSAKDRTVVRSTRSGATCKVPRDIKQHLKTQIYDYPYLDKYHFVSEYYNGKTFPGIDIVYISNGEPNEERWYDTLCYRANLMSRDIAWIRGVNGRTAAYQAAARASTTPWFFAVFAKLEVDLDFPWQDWMPDYWQAPKHYIFNARNPVNGLEYGHQGIIAYNRRLVLENNTPGIDFTLSQPHESVPILSGVAHFNQDAWMTWRTAFREVIKLKHFDATAPTLENSHRLAVWCNQAQGNYSNYCLQGAQDAVKYYEEVNGDYEQLKLSFEWAWLQQRYNKGTK